MKNNNIVNQKKKKYNQDEFIFEVSDCGIKKKKRIGYNSIWRIICKVDNCLSIAKGSQGKCITHGGGYNCKIENCNNISRSSFNYCNTHKHLYKPNQKKQKQQKQQKQSNNIEDNNLNNIFNEDDYKKYIESNTIVLNILDKYDKMCNINNYFNNDFYKNHPLHNNKLEENVKSENSMKVKYPINLSF